ncbi:hypothetical protein VHEMI03227 [[Torrubiella] hemipterigena]|uniref:Uncharacterized protein n=1 Tax=[Torrubiella] hemipterigena TaxID=1531966 RepID=A0A0A1TAA2_9HYPO|nr:hypothetical protein VHEMI03227 [[Torrubiella] hemipterigena]
MLSQLAVTATLALAAVAANCGNGVYPECVSVYKGTGCQSFNKETSYRPTCEGNCYVYPFDSLQLAGSAFKNVDCVAYSDTNCQNKIGDTGNVSGGCYSFKGGNSMKCYHGC